MGILQTLGQAARAGSQTSIREFPGYGPGTSFGGQGRALIDLLTRRDNEQYVRPDKITSNSIVSICLDYIGRNIILANALVQEDGQDGWETADHPLGALLETPNQFYDINTLISTTGASLATGNSYWIKVRDVAGNVRELWWAPQLWGDNVNFGCTPWATPDVNDGLPYCYLYRAGGTETYLPLEDVVHFRLPKSDKFNPFIGHNPLMSQLPHIGADNVIAEYTYFVAKNFGVIGGLMSNKSATGIIADDVRETGQKQWAQRTTGKNLGKLMMMAGDWKLTFPDASPEKMAIGTLGDPAEERIPACLGLNAMAVQLGAGLNHSTYSNATQATASAWDQGITPLHTIIAGAVNRHLVPDFARGVARGKSQARVRLWFDYSQVASQQEDVNAKRASVNAMWAANGLTVGQYHAMLGMDLPDSREVDRDKILMQLLAEYGPGVSPLGKLALPPRAVVKTLAADDAASPSVAVSEADIRAYAKEAQSIIDSLPPGSSAKAASVRESLARMGRAADELREGRIDLKAFESTFTDEVTRVHSIQGAIGYGGPVDALPDHVVDYLGRKIAEQQEYAKAFVADIKGGRYDMPPDPENPDGPQYTTGVTARTQQYANASRGTYENVHKIKGADLGHDEGQRILADVDSCDECAEYASRGWVPIDEVPDIGDECSCHGNCNCIIVTRKGGSDDGD